MRSEVFDNLVKIAQKSGIISDKPEHTEKTEDSPRWDSLDVSAIEALYGVKPDPSKGMEYENNIMEVAHPNSLVISPSYDKINGLIENEVERQNINMHIVQKNNDGLLTQQKYAEKNLLLSLVRVANDMDNKDQEDLRILADKCLEQVTSESKKKSLHKQAFPWLVAIPILIALGWANQHLNDADQGLKPNYDRLVSELTSLQNSDITLGVGETIDSFLKNQINDALSLLGKFWETYSTAMPFLLEQEKAKSHEDLKARANLQGQAVIQTYQNLRSALSELMTDLDAMKSNFSNPDFKSEHTEKGGVTSLLDSVPFLQGGKASLFSDAFDRVLNAIPAFEASATRVLQVLAKVGTDAASIDQQVKEEETKIQSSLGPDPFTNPSNPLLPIDEKAGDLEHSLRNIPEFSSFLNNNH